MSDIHYFQRYSQRENVITNNTLLLLQRLYQYRPRLLQDTLEGLFDDKQTDLSVGVSMTQQEQVGEHGIPDGALFQDSFRLLLETKMSKGFHAAQLDRHIKAFRDERSKVLLLLSPGSLDKPEVDRLTKQAASEKGVTVLSKTFEDLIAAVRNALGERDYEMQDMLSDFEKFCTDEGLLPVWQFWMRAITAGWTFEQNKEYGLYYDLSSRGYSEHAYLGLYTQKAVRSIGQIVRIVCADLVGDELKVLRKDFGGNPTPDELERIKRVMVEAETDPGYKIKEGHRFFIVGRFHDTVFEKSTPRPIMRTKFFDLRRYVPEKYHKQLPPVAELAALLNGRTWGKSDETVLAS